IRRIDADHGCPASLPPRRNPVYSAAFAPQKGTETRIGILIAFLDADGDGKGMEIDVSLGRPSREPLQGRSRASFERMLEAAEKLLVERGSDEFTLSDVSKAGKVSIGSIYCRFDSKDDLIRAV